MTGCDSENGQSSIVKGGTPPGQKVYKGKKSKRKSLVQIPNTATVSGIRDSSSRPELDSFQLRMASGTRSGRALQRLEAYNNSPTRTTEDKNKNKGKNKDKRKNRNKDNQQEDETVMGELRRLREEVAKYKAAEEQRQQVDNQHHGGTQQQVGSQQLQVEDQRQGDIELQRQRENQSQGVTQEQQQGTEDNDPRQRQLPAAVQGQLGAAALMAQGVVKHFSGVGVAQNTGTSSILPTVSGDMKKKIWAHQYIPLETLLKSDDLEPEGGRMLLVFDPTNPNNPMSLSKKKPPKIASWQKWVEAYQVLMLTMLENEPGRARELVGYQCLIMEAAAKFPLQTWLKYDEKFRKSVSEDPTKRWDQIDVQLWVVCFTLPPRAMCTICQAPNHLAKDCPAKAVTSKPGSSSVRPKPGQANPGFCYGFNSPWGCNRVPCGFKHVCSRCENNTHGKHNCPGVNPRVTSKTGTQYN